MQFVKCCKEAQHLWETTVYHSIYQPVQIQLYENTFTVFGGRTWNIELDSRA